MVEPTNKVLKLLLMTSVCSVTCCVFLIIFESVIWHMNAFQIPQTIIATAYVWLQNFSQSFDG